jgi:hypothetical protein
MSSSRKRSGSQPPHASRESKVRDAKGKFAASGAATGGIGEAPQSRVFKFSIIAVIFLIILFIVMDFIDRGNAKKERENSGRTSVISSAENYRTHDGFIFLS